MTRSFVTTLQWLVYVMDIKHRMQQISNGKHVQDSVGITDLLNPLMHFAETALWTAKCKYQIVVIFLMLRGQIQLPNWLWILFMKIAIKRLNVFPNIEVHFPLVLGNFCKCKKLSQFAFHFAWRWQAIFILFVRQETCNRHWCCCVILFVCIKTELKFM